MTEDMERDLFAAGCSRVSDIWLRHGTPDYTAVDTASPPAGERRGR
jgi:hypothetical protein